MFSIKNKIKDELSQEIQKDIINTQDAKDFSIADVVPNNLSYQDIPSSYKISFLKLMLVLISDKEYILNLKSQSNSLTDIEVYDIFNNLVKQKLSQIEFLDSIKKEKLIQKELIEIIILKHFLPKSPSQSEIELIVKNEILKHQDKTFKNLKNIMTNVLKTILKKHQYAQINKYELSQTIKNNLLEINQNSNISNSNNITPQPS